MILLIVTLVGLLVLYLDYRIYCNVVVKLTPDQWIYKSDTLWYIVAIAIFIAAVIQFIIL